MVKGLDDVIREEVDDFYISPPIIQILNEGELDSALKMMITSLKERTTEAEGNRGGIAMITHRHAEANNPEMGDAYDEIKEHSCSIYLDANNLYGWATCQPLPDGEFQWNYERDADKLIELYANNPKKGCTVFAEPKFWGYRIIYQC